MLTRAVATSLLADVTSPTYRSHGEPGSETTGGDDGTRRGGAALVIVAAARSTAEGAPDDGVEVVVTAAVDA